MKYLFLIYIVFFLSFPLMGAGLSETGNSKETEQLQRGIESFNSGKFQEAINLFAELSNSNNNGIAASAYYNHGTALVKATEKIEDKKKIPDMLESAYQSIKRAWLLDTLTEENKISAQRNMQIIREKLAQMQNQSEQDSEDGESGDSESSGDETDKDRNEQNPADSENGSQEQNRGSAMNNETGDDKEQESGNEENEPTKEPVEEQTMNDILNEESENKLVRQLLESKGGVNEVDKDW